MDPVLCEVDPTFVPVIQIGEACLGVNSTLAIYLTIALYLAFIATTISLWKRRN